MRLIKKGLRIALTGAVVAFVLASGVAFCDNLPIYTPSALPTNLDSALKAALPSPGELYLAVNAASVALPSGATPPVPGDYVGKTASAYGMLVQSEGGVVAVAPPTMVVLNTNPAAPNPFDSLSPDDALKLLMSSLDDQQWSALTSADGDGLGYSDFTSDDQRQLWEALFPKQAVQLQTVQDDSDSDVDSGSSNNLPEQLPTFDVSLAKEAHLKVGKRVDLSVASPVRGDARRYGTAYYNISNDEDDYEALGVKYSVYRQWDNVPEKEAYGQPIRLVVPNTQKASAIDYDTASLKVAVDLTGAGTVDALISRIGAATGLELYAEPQYGEKPVTVIGSGSINADELLQALALCVCGTYRQVGSAFVLTDDLIGVGVRRSMIGRFEQLSDGVLDQAVASAGDAIMSERHGLDGVSFLDPATALNAAEQAKLAADAQTEPYYFPGEPHDTSVPYGQISPEQKQEVDQAITASEDTNEYGGSHLTGQGDVHFQEQPIVLMTTPSLRGAVAMNDYFSVYQLFQPSSNLRTARQKEASQLVASEPAQPVPGATIHQLQPTWHDPGLQLAEANFQVRAVLIRPAANTDWSGIFHSAKKAGFNQVWIDVFSEGQPHLASDTSPGEPSVLARAIALGAATGTSVTAVVNLLQWDKNTPLDSEDLTLNGVPYGLDSKNQSDVTAARYGYSQDNASKPWDGSANYVAPYASPATASLRSLVRLLASTGGLSTVAFCGTSPPGYARDDSSGLWTGQIGLGYTTQMRLGFLRKEHTDPIDLSEDSESMVRPTDTSLPYFPDNNSVDPIAKAWNAFRMAANKELLIDVWQKATEFKPQNPNVWIGVGFYDSPASWYGLWDGRTSDMPKVSDHMETVSEGFISRMPKTLPRAGDITVFRGFQDSSSLTVESALARMPRSWNGFLLDYSDSQAANPLAIFEPQQTDSNPAK